MVLNVHNLTPWTEKELIKRFPHLLSGAEGEGESGGDGTGSSASEGGEGGEGSGTQTTTTTTDEGKKTDEPETFPREYVETLRTENASRRQREKDLEAELDKFREAEKEREKAEMSEADRAKTEAEEAKAARESAEQALVDERKRSAVISEATRLKFRDPEDALAYIDMEDIRMTDEGRPHKASIQSAVKKVADDKKYLIEGPGSADGGSRGTSPKTDAERDKEIQSDISSRGGVPVNA